MGTLGLAMDSVSGGKVSGEKKNNRVGIQAGRALTAWIGFCVLGGLALRILGAQGDLWQDEIWTFSLIRTVSSPLGIFLDMSADNNHFLNTLYLYYVGPDASPLVQRGFSIVCGTAMIVAAAMLLWRTHWIAAAAAAAFFAFCYPMVHYGSEARGYAGFLLCAVISIDLVDRELAEPARRNRIWLGISNFMGVLFQPIMLGTVAVLIAWVVWRRWRVGTSVRQAVADTQETFSVSVRLLLVVMVLAAIAVYRVGGYKILSSQPFTPATFVQGYGGMLRYMLGLPESVPPWVVLGVVLLLVAAALAFFRHRLSPRTSFYVLAMFGLPAALFCSQLPNLIMYRYHLVQGVAFLLLLAEIFALAWRSGGWARALALAVTAGFAIGNAVEIDRLLTYRRGHYQEIIRTIATSGSPTVTGNYDGVVNAVMEFYGTRRNLPINYVSNKDFCTANATWYVEATATPVDLPETIHLGEPDCPATFRLQTRSLTKTLSGWSWTLYRRDD